MKHSQETFIQLVNEAYRGTLQLPAFQRDWKWERSKVISLFDSLRKQFPIGNFLFLEVTDAYDLSPRVYEGSISSENGVRVTLDGQQRITSGIALIFGLEHSTIRYFLDIKGLVKLFSESKIDHLDDNEVRKFIQDIDDGDGYMIATTKKQKMIFSYLKIIG